MSASSPPPPRRGIELLTTVNAPGQDGAVQTRCFGNILELGFDALVLETKHEQTPGDALSLSVMFPHIKRRPRTVVTFGCVIQRVRDPARLQYDLRIENMDDDARGQLIEFLSQCRSDGER